MQTSLIIHNSTWWGASIQMFEFLQRRYPLCPAERNCQTQSLSSLGVVWRCGATPSQPSGYKISESWENRNWTFWILLTWTGSWSVLTSCLSLTPHLRITFYISNLINLMFDIWTTSSQLDVEMSQTDSIIHWKIQCSFRHNYIIVLAGSEAEVELSLASSSILECLNPANQTVWVRRNFENFSDFPRNCQIVKGSLWKLVKNIHNGPGRRELSREISCSENDLSLAQLQDIIRWRRLRWY